MSWTVDGVMYHQWDEYQTALNRRNSQISGQEAAGLRSEVGRLTGRIRQHETDLGRAQGDLRRQTELNQAMQADVGRLAQVQNRIETAQRRSEARMESGFREVRAAVDQVGADLSEMERRHERHAAEVRQNFDAVRQEFRAGLEEAERRRAATEQRLQAEIQEVDAKVEADRADRIARHQSETDRAGEAIDLARAQLEVHQGAHGVLDLEDEATSIREAVMRATSLRGRGDSASALALAEAAFGRARALNHSARRRGAVMKVQRETVESRASALRQDLGDPVVDRYFKPEVGEAGGILDNLETEAAGSYDRWRRAEIEAREHEKLLDRLEDHTLIMRSAAPVLLDLAKDRNAEAKRIIVRLADVYGPLSAKPTVRHRTKGDLKSPMVVECEFGGAKVDVHLELGGGYKIDAYGHASNGECSAMSRVVTEALATDHRVNQPVLDRENRTQPAVDGQSAPEEWRDVASGLSRLKSNL